VLNKKIPGNKSGFALCGPDFFLGDFRTIRIYFIAVGNSEGLLFHILKNLYIYICA
jgi:hypothetical protein